MEWYIALAASLGTGMQFLLALFDLKHTKRLALDWSVAEDELVAELRPWKRRRARRELRSERPADINYGIRWINLSMVSWMVLLGGSVAALVHADAPW